MYEEIIDLSTYYYNKTQIDNFLNGKANSYHTHNIGNVSGLQSALDSKSANGHGHNAVNISGLAKVATSGSYNDLTDKPSSGSGGGVTSYNDLTDKPNLATVATSGNYNDLTDKPNLATVATSGSYNDLTDKPTIPPGSAVDSDLDINSQNPVQNAVITRNLNNKANTTDIPNVLDTLYSDSTSDALSAAKGKALRVMIESSCGNNPAPVAPINIDNSLDINSTNPVQNAVITSALNGKSDTGHTHTIDSDFDGSSTNPLQNKKITLALNQKADAGHTHFYNDITNHPEVINHLNSTSATNVLSAAQGKELNSKISNLATVATSGNYSDLNGIPDLSEKADATHSHTWNNLGGGCYYNEKIGLVHVIGSSYLTGATADSTNTIGTISGVASHPPYGLLVCGSNRGGVSCMLETNGTVKAHTLTGYTGNVYYSFTYPAS